MLAKPFSPHAVALAKSSALPSVSASSATEWLLGAVFAVWALYTLVVVYHWLRYARDSRAAKPAIVIHLAVSALFMLCAVSGLVSL